LLEGVDNIETPKIHLESIGNINVSKYNEEFGFIKVDKN
tara:strand:+ start:470 stop:586 length:117 start_codon:yes stop_codon:yes gene_type:complete